MTAVRFENIESFRRRQCINLASSWMLTSTCRVMRGGQFPSALAANNATFSSNQQLASLVLTRLDYGNHLHPVRAGSDQRWSSRDYYVTLLFAHVIGFVRLQRIVFKPINVCKARLEITCLPICEECLI